MAMDLYVLLDIEEKVEKAYRQKASSAELFHQHSQALEVLTDAAAGAAYDKVRKAKKQAAERTQKLDEKRKKVKLDLEARKQERQHQEEEEEELEESLSTRTLEREIKCLSEEGSRQLEEQQRLIREQIHQERQGTPKLKLKWKCKMAWGESKGGYSKDVLLWLLQKYGEVLNMVLSSKKVGTAVVEFATAKAAELAVQNEVGLVDNPLKISWLEGQPQSTVGPSRSALSKGSVLSVREYESVIMMHMRHAAELQWLISEMHQQDREGQPT
uniref:DNAJC17 n=1 Tax=Pan troglodytes TaxID=9598 RepID=A0A2I3RGH6_PANTR